jgi:hypothetical protein
MTQDFERTPEVGFGRRSVRTAPGVMTRPDAEGEAHKPRG